jgi:hypothetical protein
MPTKVIEQGDTMLWVAPLNGGIELRLVADDGSPEHRLRLSEADARELLRLLKIMLEPPSAAMSAASVSRDNLDEKWLAAIGM